MKLLRVDPRQKCHINRNQGTNLYPPKMPIHNETPRDGEGETSARIHSLRFSVRIGGLEVLLVQPSKPHLLFLSRTATQKRYISKDAFRQNRQVERVHVAVSRRFQTPNLGGDGRNGFEHRGAGAVDRPRQTTVVENVA